MTQRDDAPPPRLRLAPQPAQIAIDARGGARSTDFDDIYFAPRDGFQETQAVFLDGCGLPQSWRERDAYCIGELGFGTGLNFLAAWELWSQTRQGSAGLHFVSVEGFPMEAQTARRALETAPELKRGKSRDPLNRKAEALLAAWPARIRGVHRRRFDDGVTLTLAHLTVIEALDALEFSADAWFLDGFAPARNPAMWSPEVFTALAAHSRPGARLATFTVAGEVRRGLAAVGFAVEKKPGFGAKRERLEGVFEGAPSRPSRSVLAPRSRNRPPADALIIGAGVAGAFAARALARRGLAVQVLDAAAAPASGASGNPVGLVMPRLDLDDRPEARFHRAAASFAAEIYRSPGFTRPSVAAEIEAQRRGAKLGDQDAPARPIRIAELAQDDRDSARLRALADSEALPAPLIAFAEPKAVAAYLGEASNKPALMHDLAFLVRPRLVVERALTGAAVRLGARAARLVRGAGRWRALDEDGGVLGEGAICVLACGLGLRRFEDAQWLPLAASRGQITQARVSGRTLEGAIAIGGYAIPDGADTLTFGATYDVWSPAAAVVAHAQDDHRNLELVRAAAPALAARIDPETMTGRASLRAVTPDRLPVVGPVPDAEAFQARFSGLATGRRDLGAEPGPLREGLFVLSGLGSRGFLWAPLLGEALASEICGEPGALERGAAEALHPARFLTRALKRGEA